jgi:hypothetical protein
MNITRISLVVFTFAYAIFASCSFAATNALLYSDNFEGYTNGTPLIDGAGTNWFATSADAIVQSNVTAEGSSKAALVAPDLTLSNRYSPATSTNVWLRMQSRILTYDGTTNVTYDTNATIAFYFDSTGYCVVCNGTNGWVTVTQTLAGLPATPVDTNSFTTLDVCLDYTNKTWKINVNSIELTNNLAFINTNAELCTGFDVCNSGTDTVSYLDNVATYDASRLPVLSVSPSSLTNTANATNIVIADQSFKVISTGDAQMDYHIITNNVTPGWSLVLTNNASGIMTNNATNTVWVQYNTTGLSPGVYSNSFTVLSTNWGVQTQIVSIVVDVYSMRLTTSNLVNAALRGFNATNQTFGVSAGGGALNFSASSDVAWLQVNPASGHTTAGATNILTNTYLTSGLAPGDYVGHVTIASPDGAGATGVVTVALRVYSTPILGVAPSVITQPVDRGGNPTSEYFNVWNNSAAPVVGVYYRAVEASDPDNIIQGVTPADGTSTGQYSSVGIYFNNLSGFSSGTYTAVVAVAATNYGSGYEGYWSVESNVVVILVVSAADAPSSVTATKGDYTDRVAVNWMPMLSPVGGTVTYNVLRHTTFDPGYASIIVSGLTTTNYEDSTASPGVRYYYWVQSVNSYGYVGTNSAYDGGYRRLAAPSGLFASDGEYTNKVLVGWASVDGAASYNVYRYNGSSGGIVNNTVGTEYNDVTVVEGVEYTYYVQATNSICGSDLSSGETGYVLSRPTVFSASDGTYAGKVRLSWGTVHGATAYEIWRSTQTLTPPYGGGSKITEVAGTTYDDTSVTAGTKYYYWLKSKNATALSAFSGRDEGFSATAAVNLSVWGLVVQPRRVVSGGNPDVISFRLANNGGAALSGDNSTVRLTFYSSANAVFGDADDRQIGTVDQRLEVGIGSRGIFSVPGNSMVLPSEAGSYYLFMRLAPVWPSRLAPSSEGGWITQRTGTFEVSGAASINYQSLNDYDGDGISDMVVHGSGLWDARTADGTEIARNYPFAGSGVAVMGDYDGDNKTDPVVYDESRGYWQALLSGSGYGYVTGWFGGPGYWAVPGDYDGDGKTEAAVYDIYNSLWYALKVGGGTVMWQLQFGNAGFEPVIGDYDGDGKWDLALYNEVNGAWYVRTVAGSLMISGEQWGGLGFRPVPGDYDGDGLWDFAVYDEITGRWYIVNIHVELIANGLLWGQSGYMPVAGDFDGDGIADMAVYNSSTGKWYIRTVSGTSIALDASWGGAGRTAVGEVE